VHCKVDAPVRQCLFNFFGEHALGSNFGERHIGDLVAGGLDDFNLDLMAMFTQKSADVVGLPKREL
jgi:hypothetical protein